MTTIQLVRGDITTMLVDAVVNAANRDLREGGGVCGAIFSAAGARQLQKACDEAIRAKFTESGFCPTGQALATDSFDLEQRGIKKIIHAVGPIWGRGDEAKSDELLASAYTSSLRVADELGLQSIAFPSISTGIYGYPLDRASKIAIGAVKGYRGSLSKVVLVAFNDKTAQSLAAALGTI